MSWPPTYFMWDGVAMRQFRQPAEAELTEPIDPLTDAEIAELRDWCATVGDVPASVARTTIQRLLGEVRRARALLRKVEGDAEICPACDVLTEEGYFFHRPGCELAALIAKP